MQLQQFVHLFVVGVEVNEDAQDSTYQDDKNNQKVALRTLNVQLILLELVFLFEQGDLVVLFFGFILLFKLQNFFGRFGLVKGVI